MKKSLKIIYILAIFVSTVFLLQNVALAAPSPMPSVVVDGGSTGGSTGGGGGWAKDLLSESEGWGPQNDGGISQTAQDVMGTIIIVIRIVGIGIAIIMTTYVAIKYMSAAPNEKAEFKKSATGLIVGAVVLFATSGILGILADFANQIGSN